VLSYATREFLQHRVARVRSNGATLFKAKETISSEARQRDFS
jgi:hypothetical protein